MNSVAVNPTTVNLTWTVAESPAYAWGHEDATEGKDAQGSAFFVGAALAAYNDGYAAGLAVRKQLAPVEELERDCFYGASASDTPQRQGAAHCTADR